MYETASLPTIARNEKRRGLSQCQGKGYSRNEKEGMILTGEKE